MQMTTEVLESGVTRVRLDGELDIKGSLQIDPQFEKLAESADGILVDMSGVTFLASIGIRTLVMSARSMHGRERRFAVLNPSEVVKKVLQTAGIDQIVPIFDDESSAIAHLA